MKIELKQCTKCHTMKHIEGEVCKGCRSIEQEIMEMFDKDYEKWIFHNEHGLCVYPDSIKSFISHIITLVQNREREEIMNNLLGYTHLGENFIDCIRNIIEEDNLQKK